MAVLRQVWSVLDHAHEAFIAIDAAGFVIDWNPQAQRTFGWSSQEAIGQLLAELAGLAAFNGIESADELVGRADAALYEAKASGRNRAVIAKADRVPPA